MNRITKISLLAFLLLPFYSFSQHFELGGTVGISTYSGDLSPNNSRFVVGEINPMAGVFARYNFNDFITLRFGGTYGIISADDSKSNNEIKQVRNLSFRSQIIEGSLIAEFNILGYQPYNLSRPWSPYIFGGISFFNFNPKAKYDGKWHKLQPLGTEGQGLSAYPERQKYRLSEISIPMGLGVKYALNDTWNVGIEVGIRKTFSDYLDDVSTTYVEQALLQENSELSAILADRSEVPKEAGAGRGNSKFDDWYTFTGITISRNFLDNGLVGSRKRSRRGKEGCPTF